MDRVIKVIKAGDKPQPKPQAPVIHQSPTPSITVEDVVQGWVEEYRDRKITNEQISRDKVAQWRSI